MPYNDLRILVSVDQDMNPKNIDSKNDDSDIGSESDCENTASKAKHGDQDDYKDKSQYDPTIDLSAESDCHTDIGPHQDVGEFNAHPEGQILPDSDAISSPPNNSEGVNRFRQAEVWKDDKIETKYGSLTRAWHLQVLWRPNYWTKVRLAQEYEHVLPPHFSETVVPALISSLECFSSFLIIQQEIRKQLEVFVGNGDNAGRREMLELDDGDIMLLWEPRIACQKEWRNDLR